MPPSSLLYFTRWSKMWLNRPLKMTRAESIYASCCPWINWNSKFSRSCHITCSPLEAIAPYISIATLHTLCMYALLVAFTLCRVSSIDCITLERAPSDKRIHRLALFSWSVKSPASVASTEMFRLRMTAASDFASLLIIDCCGCSTAESRQAYLSVCSLLAELSCASAACL